MADVLNTKAILGTAIHATNGKWGWFVALGIGQLILGGIASANLMAADLVSVVVIGAALFVAGIFQAIHAFSVRGAGSALLWLFAGLVYAAAGAIVLYDPVFASFTLSLVAGLFLVAAGIIRALAGFNARPASGWAWLVAAGVLTFCVGIVVVAAWPAIGLWLLGAMLVVDLIFEGCGLIAFGVALKARSMHTRISRRQHKP